MTDERERMPISTAPLSVILLADNDGKDFDDVVAAWILLLDGLRRNYQLILVDDGSTDGTAARADGFAAKNSKVKVIHHPSRMGTGAALRSGVSAATFPLLFYTTSDRQFHPDDLHQMLAKIDQVDAVIGIRRSDNIPWLVEFGDFLKRLIARVFIGLDLPPRTTYLGLAGAGRRFISRWIFGLRVTDPECYFRLFRRDIFRRLTIQSEGIFAHHEIVAKANFLGALMDEVTLPHQPNWARAASDLDQGFRLEAFLVFCRPDFGPAKLPEMPRWELPGAQ